MTTTTTSGNSSRNRDESKQEEPQLGTTKKRFKIKIKRNENEPLMISAMERAQEFERTLPLNTPSCVMCMNETNVNSGFMIQFPADFYKKHLPHTNSEFVLETHQDGTKHTETVKYLFNEATGSLGKLSGKWQRFSKDLGLEKGDVLVFQLIPLTFQVYIFKKSQLTEVGAAIPMDTEEQELLDSDKPDPGSNGDLKFEDVKFFGDFKVQMDSTVFKSQRIPERVKQKYYDLCSSQTKFLHGNATRFNNGLLTGMISETVDIADAVRQVKSTTPMGELQKWYEALGGFKKLGMDVGFLRARIRELKRLHKYKDTADAIAAVKLKYNCTDLDGVFIAIATKPW